MAHDSRGPLLAADRRRHDADWNVCTRTELTLDHRRVRRRHGALVRTRTRRLHCPARFSLKQNLGNDYLIDRHVQKTQSYTGIKGTNTQDFALQEGHGPDLRSLARASRHDGIARSSLTPPTPTRSHRRSRRRRRPAGHRPIRLPHRRATDRVVPSNIDWRETLREELLARF